MLQHLTQTSPSLGFAPKLIGSLLPGRASAGTTDLIGQLTEGLSSGSGGNAALLRLPPHLKKNGRSIDGALIDLEYQRIEMIRFNLFDSRPGARHNALQCVPSSVRSQITDGFR